MLKPPKELATLDEDSDDIYQKGVIDRYAKRPAVLEECCLADFAAWYEFKGKQKKKKPSEAQEVSEESMLPKELKIESGWLEKRDGPKIIRFCNFNRFTQTSDFFRERVMLFWPWRVEESEVENADCKRICSENSEVIDRNSKKYIKLTEDINEIVKQIEERRNAEELDIVDPNDETDQLINAFGYDDNIIRPDLNLELNDCTKTNTADEVTKRYKMPDQLDQDEYFKLCDSLNTKQRDYLMHIINKFKSNSLPVYDFISGGAGVGKSQLIKAIYQSLLRVFRGKAGPVEEKPKILIVSYTGKAAHNVGGITAHSAFSLTIGQGAASFKNLGEKTVQALYNKLSELQTIIIDEISMLGERTLHQIDCRLNQVCLNHLFNELVYSRQLILQLLC